MSAYLVVALDIDDPDVFRQYQRGVVRTFKVGEGRVLSATAAAECIEGETPRGWNVLVEFPSVAMARKWYDSPEYQAVKGLRLASSSNASIRLMEGL
ncbi:MAG: DUF1330 domain-containing protein [Deltaproteobacteria bacterium]|nr:DUF1330 domain-containing protein [Deltaproteobacteria bacterium]